MVAAKFPRFLELPTELQISILRQYLIVRRPITARTHVMCYGPVLANLARVSKYVHGLAIEIYYKENIFLFNRSHITGAAGGPAIFRFPKAPVGHHIRTIELKVTFDPNFKSVDDMLRKRDWQDLSRFWEPHTSEFPVGDYYPSDFLVLIRPHSAPRYDRDNRLIEGKTHTYHSDWQLHCPNLKDVKINIELAGCMDAEARTALQELPNAAVIPMKAEKPMLEVQAPVCVKRFTYNPKLCDGTCAQILHGVLESMLHDSKDPSNSDG